MFPGSHSLRLPLYPSLWYVTPASLSLIGVPRVPLSYLMFPGSLFLMTCSQNLSGGCCWHPSSKGVASISPSLFLSSSLWSLIPKILHSDGHSQDSSLWLHVPSISHDLFLESLSLMSVPCIPPSEGVSGILLFLHCNVYPLVSICLAGSHRIHVVLLHDGLSNVWKQLLHLPDSRVLEI